MDAHISEITPEPGERSITIGASRAGKSALEDHRHIEIMRQRPHCMSIVVDTKPRYRAETERGRFRKGRKSAAYRYESWAKGPTLPNSVVLDLWDDKPFADLWNENRPAEVVLMQSGEAADWKRMLYLLNAFVKAEIKGRERLLRVDEALDFYQRNTLGIDPRNDVFYRAARAGGERNIGLMLDAHRLHGLPPLILAMATRITIFHLRTDSDMKYLHQIGIPDGVSPKGNYVFREWTIQPGGTVSPPFTGRADYPESYLRQLAPT